MARTRLPSVVVVLLGLATASPVGGQVIHELGTEGARWHSAQRLQAELETDSAQPAAALRLAVLELSIGRPERARALLTADSGSTIWPVDIVLPLLASAEYQLERYDTAARLFERGADLVRGTRRGVLLVRAGDARERAGESDVAADLYRAAAAELPGIGGWLALREARLTKDTTHALALLRETPEAATKLRLHAQANILLAVGDTSGAVEALASLDSTAEAAFLALLAGDSLRARGLAYEAIARRDTSVVRAGLRIVVTSFEPRTAEEYRTLARAHHRTRRISRAVEAIEAAVRLDSSETDLLVYWGDLLDESGARERALEVYRKASSMGDEDAEVAAFRYGRLLFRMRRYRASIEALAAFADSFPGNRSASVAIFLAAQGYSRIKQVNASDSTYATVSERWPRSSYASRSRLLLASRALDRGDTTRAVEWYRIEVELGGPQRFAAHYRVATLSTDSLEARGVLAVLARADSLGYYGTIARSAADLPPLNVKSYEPGPISRTARETLAELDLLRESRLLEEASALVAYIAAQSTRPPTELLDLAEGLIERGFMSEGISLGWAATRAYTLNHPRVLRVIFPWPERETIEAEARAQGLDPYVLVGLIRQESAFRADVVSRAGAYGLMQLMPPTAKQLSQRLGLGWDKRLLVVSDANLHLGATHFANLVRRYNGDILPALAAYNAGATPVRRWLRYPEAGDPVRWIERVPYAETQGYLRTIVRNRALYRALYPPLETAVAGNP